MRLALLESAAAHLEEFMQTRMLVGAALGALMAGSAQAQVQTGPGFFGHLDGMYLLPTDANNVPASGFGVGGQARAGEGWGIEGKFGYRFDSPLDIALSGRYFDQGVGKGAGTFDWHGTDGRYYNIEAQVGYTISSPGFGVRPFIGVMYQNWQAKFADSFIGLSSTQKSWGVGPHIGADVSYRLGEAISLIAGVDTAFLYGKAKSNANFAPSGSNDRLFWNIGGKIGVDWEVVPLVHVAVGYRADWFDGLHFASPEGGAGPKGRAGELIHGPFVRVAYNWGAPPPGAPAAPPPAPSGTRSFIVFFDFDRSNLTATAVQTIRQAADQAKAGRSTRIDVTGHADRAGTDAYNMALSLRRANAVKDQLVREGIPATQIAVVGRGESQPLVPTADGVREPQNRRVEIVIN
jgi:hypothetical protein